MPDQPNSVGGWSLLAAWICASAIGWAAGLAGGTLLTMAAADLTWVNEDRFFTLATLISLGLTIGAAQSMVLRRYLPQPVRWVAATLAGHLLCLIIIIGGNLTRLGAVGAWDDVLLLGLLGAAIGVPQWWVLRQHYRMAGLWVLGIAVGFLWFVWMLIDPSHSPGELVVRGTLIGALAAAVTGVTLVRLVRQPLAAVSQRAV